jgi:hypothetical protein
VFAAAAVAAIQNSTVEEVQHQTKASRSEDSTKVHEPCKVAIDAAIKTGSTSGGLGDASKTVSKSIEGMSMSEDTSRSLVLTGAWEGLPETTGYGSPSLTIADGLCAVQGVAKCLDGTCQWAEAVTKLPQECMPTKSLMFNGNNHDSTSRVDVKKDGSVKWMAGANKHKFVGLSGIVFAPLQTMPSKIDLKEHWASYGAEFGDPSFIVKGGLCCLEGAIKAEERQFDGTRPAAEVIAQLPSTCRPSKRLIFNANSDNAISRIDILPSGQVMWANGMSKNPVVSLAGIVFSAGATSRKALVLDSNWSAFGGEYGTPSFVKSASGRFCSVEGLIKSKGGTTWGKLATLPIECRPGQRQIFNMNNHDLSTRLDVLPDGSIMWAAGGKGHGFLSLSGMLIATASPARSSSTKSTNSAYANPQAGPAKDSASEILEEMSNAATTAATTAATVPVEMPGVVTLANASSKKKIQATTSVAASVDPVTADDDGVGATVGYAVKDNAQKTAKAQEMAKEKLAQVTKKAESTKKSLQKLVAENQGSCPEAAALSKAKVATFLAEVATSKQEAKMYAQKLISVAKKEAELETNTAKSSAKKILESAEADRQAKVKEAQAIMDKARGRVDQLKATGDSTAAKGAVEESKAKAKAIEEAAAAKEKAEIDASSRTQDAQSVKAQRSAEAESIRRAAIADASRTVQAAQKLAEQTDPPTPETNETPAAPPSAPPSISNTSIPTYAPTDQPTMTLAPRIVILRTAITGLKYDALQNDAAVLQGVKATIKAAVANMFPYESTPALLQTREGLLQYEGVSSGAPSLQVILSQGVAAVSNTTAAEVAVKVLITPMNQTQSKEATTSLAESIAKKAKAPGFLSGIVAELSAIQGIANVTTGVLGMTEPVATVQETGMNEHAEKRNDTDRDYKATERPSLDPTEEPTRSPSTAPTLEPTPVPTLTPTLVPTVVPSASPSEAPTDAPTEKKPCARKKITTAKAPKTPATDEAPLCTCNTEGTQKNEKAGDFCWLSDDHSPQTCTLLNGQVAKGWSWARCTFRGEALVKCKPKCHKTKCPTKSPTNSPTEMPTAIPSGIPTTVPTILPTTVPTAVPTMKADEGNVAMDEEEDKDKDTEKENEEEDDGTDEDDGEEDQEDVEETDSKKEEPCEKDAEDSDIIFAPPSGGDTVAPHKPIGGDTVAPPGPIGGDTVAPPS